MITQYQVTDTWQAITTAGQSGSAWLGELDDLSTLAGGSDVMIYHTYGSAPTGTSKLEYSKRLYKPSGNNDVMILSADNGNDIFYARCKTAGSKATIYVDVV